MDGKTMSLHKLYIGKAGLINLHDTNQGPPTTSEINQDRISLISPPNTQTGLQLELSMNFASSTSKKKSMLAQHKQKETTQGKEMFDKSSTIITVTITNEV